MMKISNVAVMPEHFRFWLRRLAAARGLNQSQLALELDLSQSVIQRWWSGTSKPGASNAARLADYFGVSREEVFELIGVPLEETAAPRREQPFTTALAELLARQPVAVPIHEQGASAGFGDEVLEYVYWSAPRAAGRNIVGMKVHGNSMEPEIRDGDIIYVDKDAAPKSGDVVVASVGPGIVVKYYRDDGRRKFLQGGDGKTMDMKAAKIEGVVIQLSRDVR